MGKLPTLKVLRTADKERGKGWTREERKSSSRPCRGLHPAQRDALPQPPQTYSRLPTGNPHLPQRLLLLEPESVHGCGAEQREGLSLNRGCRASLQQIPHATSGWKPGATPDGSNRPGHQGRCAPSPIHRSTTDGGKAVVLRKFASFRCSNKDEAQSRAGGGGRNLAKIY